MRFKRQSFRDIQNMAESSGVGGGSAKFGKLATHNNAADRTDQFSATGSASGDASGEGRDFNVFDNVNSRSQSSFRLKRQALRFSLQSMAEGLTSGKGSARSGELSIDGDDSSFSNPQSGSAKARGRAMGSGQDIDILDSVKTHSETRGRLPFDQ